MKRARVQPTLLTSTLCHPEQALDFDKEDWEYLVWQSRAAELMPQLHRKLGEVGALERAPDSARRHLGLAHTIAVRHSAAVRGELQALEEALSPLGVRVLLLKGAAYAALSHAAGVGRIFNDIDIMVPKASLPAVEERLHWAGWFPSHTTAYDERYYREWMHEIPPLEHKSRGTVLDVHHTILPPTSGIRPDPEDLFAASLQLPNEWRFFGVLAPADMVIHSACHLFFGEFHKGLRDLFDLNALLIDFSSDPDFWDTLVVRARHLKLGLPLLDALEQCRRIYLTPVPASVREALAHTFASPWPSWLRAWLFDHALRPSHASASGRLARLAQWSIFVRSHWLRMPLPLLTRHVMHKLVLAR